MREGNLDIEKFKYFMIQDYLFDRLLQGHFLAVTKATNLNSMNHFSSLLNETLNSEMQLHRDFCSEIGIPNKDLESASAMPATSSYTNYLLSTAYNNTIEEIVASLPPCQWGYDEIGRNLENSTNAKDVVFINKWIEGYTNSEYRDLTKRFINYINELSDNASNTTKKKMMDKFLCSIRYEYLFWDSAELRGLVRLGNFCIIHQGKI